MMKFLIQLASAALIGICSSIFLSAPRSTWRQTAFSALIGWLVRYGLIAWLGISSPIATYISSINISVLSQYFARKYKKPSSTFFVPGFFTMVPGSLIYRMVFEFMNGNPDAGNIYLYDTILTGIAIVLAIFTIESILYKTKFYKDYRDRVEKMEKLREDIKEYNNDQD